MIGDPHISRVRFLYKTILKLHKGLPEDLRLLGTVYLRDEFKRHRNVDVVAASRFLASWTDYAINLMKQLDVKSNAKLGQNLGSEFLDNFTEEQIAQLYELRKATRVESES